jgi:HSP20 family protein
MNLEPWDPWSEMERVRAEADRMLASFLDKMRQALPGVDLAFVPPLDMVETPSEYRLYVSVPGIVEEDIDLSVEGDWLIVRGERDAPFDPERVQRLQTEWKYGVFERRIRFPADVDRDKISATCESGVLTIRAPKKQP